MLPELSNVYTDLIDEVLRKGIELKLGRAVTDEDIPHLRLESLEYIQAATVFYKDAPIGVMVQSKDGVIFKPVRGH